MLQTICVYCSSSNRIAAHYFEMADEVGRLLAQRGYTLLYGGGNVGLMGQMARAACSMAACSSTASPTT